MNKSESYKNPQDIFLNELIKNKEIAEVNLINGIILTGKIIKYDNFSLLIDISNRSSLIYKHAISYVSLKKKIKNKLFTIEFLNVIPNISYRHSSIESA